jgi:hypothetical protein
LAIIFMGTLAHGFGGRPLTVSAQGPDEEWADPVNLSRSGGAENPSLVVTSSGAAVVVWDDVFTASETRGGMGGAAVRLEGEWGAPAYVGFPFAGRPTQFVAGTGSVVHAFWADSTGLLRHAAALVTSFGSTGSWGGAQVIASSVAAFDVAVDSGGRFHLVCLIASEGISIQSGIYYLRSGSRGEGWSLPSPIYLSDYYRAFIPGLVEITPGEFEARVSPGVEIEVGEGQGSQQVFMAWDNPSLKRNYLAVSLDGGGSWGPVTEIESPSLETPYSTPRGTTVSAEGDRVLLLWQVSEEGGSCTQVYQSSSDGGTTWSDPAPVLPDQATCPEGMQVLGRIDRYTVVFAALQSRALLLAWDGEEWSLPQTESALDNFTDPETFNSVEFGCRQAALVNDLMLVVGCGAGSDGADVWFTQRLIGDMSAWFAPSVGWRELGETAISPTDVLSLAAAGSGDGEVFVLWSQPGSESSERVTSEIYYVGWDQQGLIGPFPVLTQVSGLAQQVDLLFDHEGRLQMVWTGGEAGDLAFSWSSALEAGSSSGWNEPEPVPSRGVVGESPSLVETGDGSVYLSYAIAFNESRGVYLAASAEAGLQWDTPVQVFDGALAGCDRAGQVSLASVGESTLHLAWVCSSMPGGIGPLSLYHSRSDDRGNSWSQPAEILMRSAAWGEIEADGEGNLHLVWEEHIGGRINTWDSQSRDGGRAWDEPLSISVVDGMPGRSTLVADRSGRLHLLQAVQEEDSPPVLRYTEWDGSSWTVREGLSLQLEGIADLAELTSTAAGTGDLVVVYAGLGGRDASGVRVNELHLAAIPLRPAPASTAGAGSADSATATPAPRTPVATVEESPTTVAFEPSGPVAGSETAPAAGPPIGVIAGVATAGILVAGLIIARLRTTRSASREPMDRE